MDKNDKHSITGGLLAKQPPEEFKVRSATSGVCFDFEDVSPIQGSYIGVDDSFEIVTSTGNNTSAGQVNVRVLGLDGLIHPFQFVLPLASPRLIARQRFQLMEGWILSATVSYQDSFLGFEFLYSQLAIVRSPFGLGNSYEVLCAGYVYSNFPLAYPSSINQKPTDGAGVVRVISGSVPAAGADINETVPNNVRWRLISLRATLTTAVAVANRDVSLTYDSGGPVYMESISNLVLAASSSNIYNFFDSATLLGTAFNGRTVAPLPSNGFLRSGDHIRTATTGIQAADQWTAPVYEVIEWLDNV